MDRKIKIGMIGFGRMGRKFFRELVQNPKWQITHICDTDPACRAEAAASLPGAVITADEDEIFSNPEIQVAGLFALADSRASQIKKALAAGKHVLAEKPVAADITTEWELVSLIERSGLMVSVNMFNRNAWYHKQIIDFIRSGEIGDLAIVRICHMTPGFLPGEGHDYEGPSFHDCGMHYVDVARWYAASEYDKWHAQGVRMWAHKDPWWVQAHGTFRNGVVFDITQGFVYGHMARQQTHNSYVDVIGTKGIARMNHDFKTARVELHGVNRTESIEKPFNDKKIDVLVDVFADSLLAGRNMGYPEVRDSVIASEYAWKMLEDAVRNDPPVIGSEMELEQIRQYRSTLTEGYGLPCKPRN
ncbi:MAG: Gfo/Idh/MocA family oxidoreductase [Alistipes sp.]|nr:Gfo/Idh/MocA family oxidoreductase [Alistipes sp.]